MAPASANHRVKSASWLPLAAAGAVGIAGGIIHGNAGALGAGLVFLAMPFIALGLTRRAIRGLSIERILPESAFEGDSVEVTLRVRNGSRVALVHPIVSEIFGPELHNEKRLVFPGRIRPGEVVTLRYTGECILPRGIYRVGPVKVVASDPFGWFEVHGAFESSSQIKIYPAVHPLETADPLGNVMSRLRSDFARGGPGASDAFFGVRDYRRGDPLRIVHWGLTAHRGAPIVREFQRNARRELAIFFDRNRDALIGVGRGSSIENAVKITAALASDGLRRGHRVRLIAGTGKFATRSATGRDHMRSILDVLVHVKPNGEGTYLDLLEAHDTTLASGSSALVMLSPYLHDDFAISSRLGAWRKRGIRVTAVLFDGPTFRRLEGWGEMASDAREVAAKLERSGIKTFVLGCNADLRAAFAEAAP